MAFKLGFVGSGNMAEAIARAAVDRGVLEPEQIIASDPLDGRRKIFKAIGAAVTERNDDVLKEATHVLLAVKPQILLHLTQGLARLKVEHQVVMSIMAGISTERIERMVGRPARVVRIMPNTPLIAGAGMAGIALGQYARPDDDDLAMKLFSAAGLAIRVDECMLDAITAVSGSGPAYVFYLAEAMEEAARVLGLGEHAPLLVRQTLLGATQLMCQSESPPTELRRKVTSPGGTTEVAIEHLDGNATTDVIVNAIKAAAKRSRELGA